jgi:MFS family permease
MRKKWLVLAMYALAAGLSQFLWLNYAPLISLVEKRYGVSENVAGLLLLVFPLVYVFLSVPAGSLIDRRGYRYGIGLGCVLMAVFACLRAVELPEPVGFWWLLACQIGISVGQPYVVNGISKLVLDWFEREEEGMATGIGTVGMFLGMAAGMAATPPLVGAIGLQATMAAFGALSVAICLGHFAIVRPNPAARAAPAVEAPISTHLRAFLADRDMVLVFVLSFLGLGFFNGLTTWLEPILARQAINSSQAGIVGGLMIVGGIAGAALIPAISDRIGRRKPVLLLAIVGALALLYPLCLSGDYALLIAAGAGLGFFFLPAYSILLSMCSELAGPARAGAATGVLMLIGNVGGVLVIMAMQWVKSDASGWLPAVHLMGASLAIGVVLAVAVKETGPGRKSGVASRGIAQGPAARTSAPRAVARTAREELAPPPGP